MDHRITRFVGFGGAIALLWAASSCGNDTAADRIQVARLSEGCLINTDCEEPLVCAFRRCHEECTTSRDCDPGQRCVSTEQHFAVCQLPEDRDCVYNSECLLDQLCARDGQCRDQCVGDRDCLGEQLCIAGTCADERELRDGGLPQSGSIEVGTGSPCTYNSDCPQPLACVGRQCRLECVMDRDCLPTFRCNADNRCEPAGANVDGG